MQPNWCRDKQFQKLLSTWGNMTCIVGLVGKDGIYLGGDSASVGAANWSLSVRADEKVFINGDFIFGFTSSFRMGQILRFGFTPPRLHSNVDLYEYMVTSFIDAVRQRFKDAGYISNEKGQETGGTFLVGHGRRLFRVDGDFQVGEASNRYDAVGCGQDVALGALYATRKLDGFASPKRPWKRPWRLRRGIAPGFVVRSRSCI